MFHSKRVSSDGDVHLRASKHQISMSMKVAEISVPSHNCTVRVWEHKDNGGNRTIKRSHI